MMLAQRSRSAHDESAWDQKEMSFTEHLRELRKRLLISAGTVGVLAVALFWPSQFIIRWLIDAYFKGIALHAFGPADVIMLEFKFSIYAGIVLGLPILLYQAWMFVVPAFHPRTRGLVYLYITPSIVLAAAGIAFAHFVVLPRVVRTLLNITTSLATPTFGVEPTLNLVLVLLLAFALIFQTPVIMIALARIGVINSGQLRKWRKYAFFGFFVAGGFLAPDGNPITMTMLAGPMYVLYEASLWIIVLLEKSWHSAKEGT